MACIGTGDQAQPSRAKAIIGHEPVFVPRTVLLEAEWVLRKLYDLGAQQAIGALRAFAGLPGVTVEDATLVARAMQWAEEGCEFADAMHAAAASHCQEFLTFDKRFARAGNRLGLIPFSTP